MIDSLLRLGALICLLAPTTVNGAADSSHDIVFYDPDVNYDALPRIVKSLNDHLSLKIPGYKLRVLNDASSLMNTLASSHIAYALISSEMLDKLEKVGGIPLLVPETGGSVYYHKVLVDTGKGPSELRHKRLAVATGDGGQDRSGKVITMLQEAGLKVDGATVLATTKDFDALLGLVFGLADAALVTSDSIELLHNVNPNASSSLRVLWTSGNIMRPVLVAIKSNEDARQRPALMLTFTDIMQSTSGASAMESLGFDRWIPYTNSLLAKEKRP